MVSLHVTLCYTESVSVYVHVVYNLASGKDMEETNAKVDSYRKENEAIIKRNRMRQVRKIFVAFCVTPWFCVTPC